MVDDYLKNLIQQASDSYDLLNNLKDKPGDIEIIKRELAKIRGLVQVVETCGEPSFMSVEIEAKFFPFSSFSISGVMVA